MIETMRPNLQAMHAEEIADCNKYMKLCHDLKETDPRAAGIFRDIANDEESHAKAIAYIMDNFI